MKLGTLKIINWKNDKIERNICYLNEPEKISFFLAALQCFFMIIHVVNGYNVKPAFCNHSCCA